MKTHHRPLKRKRAISLAVCLIFCALLGLHFGGEVSQVIGSTTEKAAGGLAPLRLSLQVQGRWEKRLDLQRGETFELSVSLPRPSLLPPHGRVGVRWKLVEESPKASDANASTQPAARSPRKPDAFGIYTKPTTDWDKVLHALDSDIYLVYCAPVTGQYLLEIAPVVEAVPVFEGPRWRESGTAPQAVAFPRHTPWSRGKSIPLTVVINPVDLSGSREAGTYIEQEPNDTPEQAQEIALGKGDGNVQVTRISGGADDTEYFDNGQVGQSGDDWFRIT